MDELRSTSGALAGRRRAPASQARLRASALPRDGRVLELRHLLHDHLDSRGLLDVVLHRVPVGRPGRDHLGLAARRLHVHHRRARDGRDRLDVPHRRRPLLLGVKARQPRVGLVHRLVQPRRTDRGHCGDRLRRGHLHDLAAEPLVPVAPEHAARDLRHVHRDHRPPPGDQPARRQAAGRTELDLGVVAHGRRRGNRRDPDHRSGSPSVGELRLHEDDQQLRVLGAELA